jgi:hypothetical protein
MMRIVGQRDLGTVAGTFRKTLWETVHLIRLVPRLRAGYVHRLFWVRTGFPHGSSSTQRYPDM